jgi:hypothetical protein
MREIPTGEMQNAAVYEANYPQRAHRARFRQILPRCRAAHLPLGALARNLRD